jgi:glutamine synthetase
MTDTLAAKLKDYDDRGVRRVKLGLADLDGVIRGKYISLEKFASVMEKGGGFCDCVFGWDVDDQLYDNSTFTGWHTGFPDAQYRLLSETERWLEDEGVPYFIGEFVGADDADNHPLCPRSALRRVLRLARELDIDVRMGLEYEFFVFDETPHTLQEKGFRNLTPLTPGNFGYSMLRASTQADLFNGLMDYCAALGCPVEGLHCETGPGVWEAALEATDAIAAADQANLFKTFCKVYFARRQRVATFMAKWSMDYPGQSGHCHFSFLDPQRDNLFYDDRAEHCISRTQRQAIAGVVRYLPELIALIAPTINSYTRLVKGAWAPTASTWGIENRTAALRVIGGSASSQRLECRAPGADANPYLVAAAVIGAALVGIQNELEPDASVRGNAYDVQDDLPVEQQFATNLRDAAARLDGSGVARELFGEVFVDHFVASRVWEAREHERTVNDWQLRRYFEII